MVKPLSDDMVKEWKRLADERLSKGIPPDMGAYRAIIDLCETILIERHPMPVFENLIHQGKEGKP
jgi:hypothetical protein